MSRMSDHYMSHYESKLSFVKSSGVKITISDLTKLPIFTMASWNWLDKKECLKGIFFLPTSLHQHFEPTHASHSLGASPVLHEEEQVPNSPNMSWLGNLTRPQTNVLPAPHYQIHARISISRFHQTNVQLLMSKHKDLICL